MSKVEQVRPKWYQTKPTFDFGLWYPCPYIWFAWWLITWEPLDDGIEISIRYLPD